MNNEQLTNLFNSDDAQDEQNLMQYVQSLSPEAIAQLSQPESPEVFQMMERNIGGLLGNLPQDSFNVMVSTSREQLGRLLASAMMGGYFIRNAEQRLNFEKTLRAAEPSTAADAD